MSATNIVPRKRGAREGRLNVQQQLFLRELLADPTFNGTAAARKAGYRSPGQVANKLLKHPVIAAILGKAMREREERLQITADQVIVELARIAFADPQAYYRENGSLKPIHELTPAEAAAIREIESDTKHNDDGSTTVVTKYKFHDKVRALELLSKHFSLLNEKVQHEFSGAVTLDFVTLVKQLEDRRSNVIDDTMIEKIAKADG